MDTTRWKQVAFLNSGHADHAQYLGGRWYVTSQRDAQFPEQSWAAWFWSDVPGHPAALAAQSGSLDCSAGR
jgi:hypothetical protein